MSPTTELDEAWVTVFGFSPAAKSYILQQFSNYGTILNFKESSDCNWIHLCYQSKLQAKKALSKNGKVFGAKTMVGVKPCLEALHESPLSSAEAKENGARPLSQAYRASASVRDVSFSEERTPQRDNTVVTRALEYMFGW